MYTCCFILLLVFSSAHCDDWPQSIHLDIFEGMKSFIGDYSCRQINTFLQDFASNHAGVEYKYDQSHNETTTLIIDGHAEVQDMFPDFKYKNMPLKQVAYACGNQTFFIDTLAYGSQDIHPFNLDNPSPFNWGFMIESSHISASWNKQANQARVSYVGLMDVGAFSLQSSVSFIHEGCEKFVIEAFGPVSIEDLSPLTVHFNDPRITSLLTKFLDSNDVISVAISAVYDRDCSNRLWLSLKPMGDDDRVAMVMDSAIAGTSLPMGFAVELTKDTYFPDVYPPVAQHSIPYFSNAMAKEFSYVEIFTGGDYQPPEGMFDDVLLFQPNLVAGKDLKASFRISRIPFTFLEVDGDITASPLETAVTMNEILSQVYAPELNLTDMNRQHEFIFDMRTGVKTLSWPSLSYAVCMDLVDNHKIAFFHHLLVLDPANITFCLEKETHRLRVSAIGSVAIGDALLDATVRENDDGVYTLTARAGSLPTSVTLASVISHFNAKYFPQTTPPSLSSDSHHTIYSEVKDEYTTSVFSNFVLNSLTITHHFLHTSGFCDTTLKGEASIPNYEEVNFEGCITYNDDKLNDLSMGLFINSVKFSTLLLDLSQRKTLGIHTSLLNFQATASIIISSRDYGDEYHLRNHQVFEGLTVETTVPLINLGDCGDDYICQFLLETLGDDLPLPFKGTIKSVVAFNLTTDLPDLATAGGYSIRNVSLVISFGASSHLLITGTFEQTMSAVSLNVTIEAQKNSSVVNLNVLASPFYTWVQLFGQELFSAHCISGYKQQEQTEVDKFTLPTELSAEIRVGQDTCVTPIVTNGHLGMDTTGSFTFLYLEIPRATLPKNMIQFILNALCWNEVILPQFLIESSCMDKLVATYSSSSKGTYYHGNYLPNGFHFFTNIITLGLRGKVDIIVDFDEKKMHLNFIIPPLKAANSLLEMNCSANKLRGPSFTVTISPASNTIDTEVSGTVYTLGDSADTTLKVSDEGYYFDLKLKVLKLYFADLQISSTYVHCIAEASFQVQGTFTSELSQDIENLIIGVFKYIVNEAEQAINVAQSEVKIKKAIVEGAKGTFTDDKVKADNAYGLKCAAAGEKDAVERKLQAVSLRCSTWVGWVCGAIEFITQQPLEAIDWVLNRTTEAYDIQEKALSEAGYILREAKETLAAAEDYLQEVMDERKLAMRLQELITQHGAAENLIHITTISFDDTIRKVSSGSFEVSLSAQLVGINKSLNVNIDLNDIVTISKFLAEQIGEGFSKFFTPDNIESSKN